MAERSAREARQLTLVVYALQLAGMLVLVMPLVGILINYARRTAVGDTIYASHFTWQIRTFWMALLWLAIGAGLMPVFGLGWIVMALAGGWFLYRAVRGILHWHRHEPMPLRS